MLRVAVAVALATALFGVAMPAVETARVDTANGQVAAELDGLAATAERLAARNDPAPAGVAGARRTVTLHLPGPSWGTASLEYLLFPGPSSDHAPGVVRYRVAGGRERTRLVSPRVVGPEGGLVLKGGGRRQLVVEYTRRGNGTVVVRHPELKSDAAATAPHDALAAPGRGDGLAGQ